MCRCICKKLIKDPRILSELALFFLIVAFTLELLFVVCMPWNKQDKQGNYIMTGQILAAGILGILAQVFMAKKFLTHEAMILWPKNKVALSRANIIIGLLGITCSLSSVVCYALSDYWSDTTVQRIGWSVPALQFSMLSYYAMVGKLIKKRKLEEERNREAKDAKEMQRRNTEIIMGLQLATLKAKQKRVNKIDEEGDVSTESDSSVRNERKPRKKVKVVKDTKAKRTKINQAYDTISIETEIGINPDPTPKKFFVKKNIQKFDLEPVEGQRHANVNGYVLPLPPNKQSIDIIQSYGGHCEQPVSYTITNNGKV